MPPKRAPGAPSTYASGRTTRVAIIATATNMNSTPATRTITRTSTSTSLAKTPKENNAIATTPTVADTGSA